MFNGKRFQKLVPVAQRKLLNDYCRYLQMGWDDFSDDKRSPEVKRHNLNLLEKALYKECPLSDNLISLLQKEFVKENLSLYLLLDPLLAWRYLATEKQPNSEAQASDVIGYATTPLARMLMVLNDENPSTYLPMSFLIILFVYLQMFISKNTFLKQVKLSKRQKESKLNGLLKNARVLLSIVRSKRLKWQLAIMINEAEILVGKFKNNKQQYLGILDYTRIILYAVIQFMLVRKRTVTKEGI